jgi:hypothetical protein
MAYARAGLQRIGSQNSGAPALWVYGTTDALTTVDASGYFNDAADIMQVGDFVFVASSSTYGIHVVTGNTRDLTSTPAVAGVVDVTNAVALGAIDSD